MKKFFIVIILTILLGFSIFQVIKARIKSDLAQPVASQLPTSVPTPQIKVATTYSQSLFVPYWTLDEKEIDLSTYDEIIYFGVTSDKQRINMSEAGAVNIDTFLSTIPENKKKLLTVRMLDSVNNFAILENQLYQDNVITDSVRLARQKGFDGIVLDLELSAMPFESIINQINSFTAKFYSEAQKDSLTFSLILYGDTKYRLRPFDLKTLAKNADDFYIMAYDFHKASGNPGPNFPLNGKETYGYDLSKMTDDFLQFIPPEKIRVIFGLFGYDWIVDSNGKAKSTGKPLTNKQIKQNFLDSCLYSACKIQKDPVSSESKVTYTDNDGNLHIVWFEDMDSAAVKEKFLKENGISSFSFWANGYF